MIRAIRPNAMAQDDATMVSGWNIAPNVSYVLQLLPGSVFCGVLLYDEDQSVLIATGAALVGTEQPCVLLPQEGQTIEMVDADLGWHLLLTTGTESDRIIRIGPAVDLPDEIHPVYGDDDIALARATAAIDAAAHYIDDVTVTCPLGLGAGLGDVVSVPVDGVAVVGQVEPITWTGTPDGAIEQAVVRRRVAIAPDPFIEIVPPTVVDDSGVATHIVGASGSVFDNDDVGLVVTAVNGLGGNVGVVVEGSNGGNFILAADGSWSFDPDGDFALLEGEETANTSITYHASDGISEAMATLTVTVSHGNAAPVAVDDTGETDAATEISGNVLTNDTDADSGSLTVSQVAGSAGNIGVAVDGSNGGVFTVGADGEWSFDPGGDFDTLTGDDTATTSVTYHVSDGVDEDEGTLTVTVSAASAGMWDPSCMTTAQWLDADDVSTFSIESGLVSEWRDKSGNNRHVAQPTSSYRPTYAENAVNGKNAVLFSGKRLASTHTTSECEHHIFYVVSDPTSPNSGCAQTTGGTCLYDKNYGALSLADQGHKGESISSGAVGAFVHRSGNIHNVLYHAISMSGVNIAHFNWQVRLPYLSVNGVPVKIGVTAPQTTTFRYNVGYDHYGSHAGHVCERIIILGSLSESDRLRIEGYLAHKWGSADKLPEGHPYKSAPPEM